MLAIFKALRRDDSGQALGEYGILLAAMAGFDRLESLASDLFPDHPTALLFGAGVAAVVLIMASYSRPRI